MLRAVLTLGGTAAGLAALLSFKTHPATVAADSAPAAPHPAKQSTAPKQSGPGKHPATAKKSGGGGTAQAATTRTLTGAVENTQYGPMQVAVVMTGRKITNVKVLQRTDLGAESQQIDASAIPKLNSETLAAQSARIDAVSGASYTSQGYKESLQSALDKA